MNNNLSLTNNGNSNIFPLSPAYSTLSSEIPQNDPMEIDRLKEQNAYLQRQLNEVRRGHKGAAKKK